MYPPTAGMASGVRCAWSMAKTAAVCRDGGEGSDLGEHQELWSLPSSVRLSVRADAEELGIQGNHT